MASLIKDFGRNRQPIVDYMKQISGDDPLVLMDATSIVSYSDNLTRVKNGITTDSTFEPIFNLLYFYCPDNYMPAYYRLFDGNLKDVTMVTMALQESGYKNALIIADKGFYSAANIKLLENANLQYIIPLKRNSTLIKKTRFKKMKDSINKFIFEDRVICFDSYSVPGKKKIYLYIDEVLMMAESRDYTKRMKNHPENYNEIKFKEQSLNFGSFAIITNRLDDAEEVYINYKSRCGVELLFDGVKNILGNDYTYMHDDHALEGWMFINHLALQVHHKIYRFLKEKQLLSKYSIRDFIEYLVAIRKVKVNDEWVLEPAIDKQMKMLKDLSISIP